MGPFIDKPHLQEPAQPTRFGTPTSAQRRYEEAVRAFNQMVEQEIERHAHWDFIDRRIVCRCGWQSRRLTMFRSGDAVMRQYREHVREMERIRSF